MYSFTNTHPTTISIPATNNRQVAFLKQEAHTDKLVREIRLMTASTLTAAFAGATDELEKQAIIEAAQEVGHLELSIQFMEQLT